MRILWKRSCPKMRQVRSILFIVFCSSQGCVPCTRSLSHASRSRSACSVLLCTLLRRKLRLGIVHQVEPHTWRSECGNPSVLGCLDRGASAHPKSYPSDLNMIDQPCSITKGFPRLSVAANAVSPESVVHLIRLGGTV